MDRWHLGFNDDRLLVYNVSGFSFRAKMNCMSGLDLVDIYFTAFLDCDLKLSHKKIAFFCFANVLDRISICSKMSVGIFSI